MRAVIEIRVAEIGDPSLIPMHLDHGRVFDAPYVRPPTALENPKDRGQAIDACHALIDDLKSGVPIWKHQLFDDGSDEWVGTP